MAKMTEEEKQRNNQNNTNNIRNAADIAVAAGDPTVKAVGAGVKAADKLTGGKSSEMLGKALTAANRISPVGRKLQGASNKLNESGASDMMGRIAAKKNHMPPTNAGAGPNGNVSSGGGQNSSLPSSSDSDSGPETEKNQGMEQVSDKSSGKETDKSEDKKPKRRSIVDDWDDEQKAKDGEKGSIFGSIKMPVALKVAMVAGAPVLIVLLVIFMLVFSVTGVFSEYDDAFGVNYANGEETGGLEYGTVSEDQQAFYDRINSVKMRYQANGKTVDSFKIVAVYHVVNAHKSSVEYKDMTEGRIEDIADAMFVDNAYNEEAFKENLISSVFRTYMPLSSKALREQMADEVFEYIENYYDLIGRTVTGGCASIGSCSYDIKGFYIKGKGNISKSMQITDLYVRLMQCGFANGHDYGGTFGQPLPGEELVPFEKYILGVAYQEIGPDSPPEAIKAQMVAARSYILARHVDMGSWRTLKQEADGKWVVQVASCTQDQVYCDPDKGCSSPGDGQWSQVYSGLEHKVGNSFSRNPMPEDSPLRTYAAETMGEMLVNDQGYVIYAGYVDTEQNKMINLARQGLDYKQILMQIYNQGSRDYGASRLEKGSCNNGSGGNCKSAGDYANWKQYEGEWADTVYLGTSGKTIHQIGCLATSIAMLVAKSGVPVNVDTLNPGTFVTYLNSHGGFSGGNFIWASVTSIAPNFHFSSDISVAGLSKQQKLAKLKELLSQPNTYVVAEVKGNTGQHWVAIDSVNGDTITMMDPGSASTDMWSEYNWANTSRFVTFTAG
ncbi:MAG: SpoIID/LytB domain-containing protein [Bacilli bacterium]|nr:SpoIID/LytB domain-containing protein [Bacilli bacterium]